MNPVLNTLPISNSSSELALRNPEEFPEALKSTLNLITINEVPRVVGSAAYSSHHYPSDVDVFEKVTVNLSREDALNFYTDQFKNIMQRLLVNSRNVKYNDFKAGIDSRFDIEIPDSSTTELRQRAAIGLAREIDLPAEDFYDLYKFANDINKYRQVLYNLKVLRWTPLEVIQGFKYLFDGKIITLSEALAMNTIVKLDVIAWVSGRFQSVEALYNLRYTDPSGKIVDFNPLGNYVQGLLEDIEKYSSGKNYSPLKVIKRMWSLSRVTKCEDLLRVLTPLLRSDIAALNQIKSDAEVLSDMIYKELTYQQATQLFSEILTFHKRAANHLSGEAYSDFEQLIDLAFPLWILWMAGQDVSGELKVLLDEVQNILSLVINNGSEGFLQELSRLNITCRNPYFREAGGLSAESIYRQV